MDVSSPMRKLKKAPLTNLPTPFTSFVGRQRQIVEVKQLLTTTRLLTLTGAAGCGKTRLAIQVAAELLDAYAHGVWWVELGSVADPKLVSQATALAFGIREQSKQALIEMLCGSIQDKHLLLVLDNCEHVLEACVELVRVLHSACSNLKILATSRQALALPYQVAWLVPSLSVPDVRHLPPSEEVKRYESVRLFVERVASFQPNFKLTDQDAFAVAEICHRLDGIPLAIELAAARVKLLTVAQIAKRLDNVFQLLTKGTATTLPRHRTLQAAIDWSYGLLSEEERALFRRLSVFAGGFTLDAAEAVYTENVLDLLTDLVEKSLVVVTKQGENKEARYHLLETLRQYGRQKLQKAGELQAVLNRHLDFFLHLAEEAEPRLVSAEQKVWLERLDLEYDNLRAALTWCKTDQGNTEACLRMAGALWRYWHMRGLLSEGREHLENMLNQVHEGVLEQSAVRAKALNAVGVLASYQGDHVPARSLLEQGLAIFRTLDDRPGIASSLNMLGNAALSQGDYAAARSNYEESLEIRRALGDKWGVARLLSNLGLIARFTSDLARAQALEQEALKLFQELEENNGVAYVLNVLGDVAHDQGDLEAAQSFQEQSAVIYRELGNKWGLAYTLVSLGDVAMSRSDLPRAQSLYRESLETFREEGDKWGIAYAFESLAAIASLQGRPDRSARLFGAAEALRESILLPMPPNYRSEYERNVATLKAQLDETTFTKAWSDGRAMSLEQAIGLASIDPTTMDEQRVNLRIHALGPARVYRGEILVSPSDWTYTKARELLFYLLSHKAKTKEQIGVDLWPEASPSQLRSNFKVTLHHLRVALGRPDWIVFENDSYTFNHSLDYWYDVQAFTSNLTQARQLQVKSLRQAIYLLEEAVKLYRGDFLEDVTVGDWYLETREELRRICLETLLTLGQLLFAESRYDSATDVYLKAIARDNYSEEAHRGLMRCYARQGERAKALRHYQTLVEMLDKELGSLPAEETVELFDRLRRGEEV